MSSQLNQASHAHQQASSGTSLGRRTLSFARLPHETLEGQTKTLTAALDKDGAATTLSPSHIPTTTSKGNKDARSTHVTAGAQSPTPNISKVHTTTDTKRPNIIKRGTSHPCAHGISAAGSSNNVIRTAEEFLALAKSLLDLDESTFPKLRGPLTSYHTATVVYLDEYFRYKAAMAAAEKVPMNRDVIENSKRAVEESRSTFLQASLGSLESILTTAIWMKETSTLDAERKDPAVKKPDNGAAISNVQLVEFEKTIANLDHELKASEVAAKNLTAELEKVRSEKDLQKKAFDDQQRKLKGSFSQKVEERVSKRVREEHLALRTVLPVQRPTLSSTKKLPPISTNSRS